jgi:DNA helicase II / ATP-dependent DNA helicase PcrA
MDSTKYLTGLNPEQRAAVEHFEGPILVLAGAGSGKTRVLTTRVAHLIHEHGVDPTKILAVTFTNKAAAEMRERIRRLLEREPAGMWIGTFHSVGARMLRRHAQLLGWSSSFTIVDADQAQREVKRTLERLNLPPKRWNPQAVHGAISAAKNQLVAPADYEVLPLDPFARVVADVYAGYQKSLKDQNAFDFDDLLVKPVELLESHPDLLRNYRRRFQFLLVDEYQDTNQAQYRLLYLLASADLDPAALAAARAPRAQPEASARSREAPRGGYGREVGREGAAGPGVPHRHTRPGERNGAPPPDPGVHRPGGRKPSHGDGLGGNIMVVGDDDQSIYGWRGADIRNILDFEKDFPGAEVVRLEQNYRSTARILDAANHVISLNTRRKGKTLRTDAGQGERLLRVETRDERDEAEWIVDEIEQRAHRSQRTPRDFVVLYRTNAQSRALEEAFRRRDMPYQIVGGTRFYERREIMDVLAYLRLISNPKDAGAFDRIVNYPRRGIGDTSQGRLYKWAASEGLSPLEAAARASEIDELRGGASGSLEAFAALIARFAGLAAHVGMGELLEQLLVDVKLYDALEAEGPEGEERIENVKELVAGAHDFDVRPVEDEEPEDVVAGSTALDRYLQKVSLLTDFDLADPEAQAVTLMTMHNAKGLEFPFVFIGGLEDGLFPLARTFDEPDELEEERRLFYVGLTRAREKVYLTHARTRRRAGELLQCKPSSFLDPIPDELVERKVTKEVEKLRMYDDTGWRRRPTAGAGSLSYRSGMSEPSTPQGIYIDYSDAQDMPRYVKGERVRHPQFGRGTIRELSGFGQDLKAVIDFEGVGRKKIVLRYATLHKEL